MEEGEPSMRSCWECNEAHEHLKEVNMLHTCFGCGKWWVYDQFLAFETDEEFDKFFEEQGIKPNESTTKLDKGYRITEITLKRNHPVATPKETI